MTSLDSPADAGLLVVRVPHQPAAIRYRAYQERLGDQSVLDWIVRRLRARTPPRTRLIVVCDAEDESDRLRAACGLADEPEIVAIQPESDAHLFHALLDWYGATHAIGAGFSHAVAPDRLIRSVASFHTGLGGELTDARDATFADPLFAVDASLLPDLLTDLLPHPPPGIVDRAGLLQEAHRRNPAVGRPFIALTLSVTNVLGLDPSRWPDRIALHSALDIELLRVALALKASGSGHRTLIDAWKTAAIALGARRSPGRWATGGWGGR